MFSQGCFAKNGVQDRATDLIGCYEEESEDECRKRCQIKCPTLCEKGNPILTNSKYFDGRLSVNC